MISSTSTTPHNLSPANSPFSNFSNVDYSNNQSYLTQAYSGRNNQQYYTDIVDIENKAKKKKKRNTLIAISTTLIGIGAVVGAFATSKYVSLDKITEAVKEAGEAAGHTKIAQQAENTFEKVQNACANFTTIKDALWRKLESFIENIPIVKGIKIGSDKLSDFYFSILKKGTQKKMVKVLGSEKAVQEFMNTVFGDNTTLDGVYKQIHGALGKGEAISEILGDNNKISNLASNCLDSGLRDKAINGIESVNYGAIVKKINNIGSLDDKQKIALKNIIAKEFIPKAGDIANGCAPTDVITAGIPIAAFGLALANEDDKEERKSLLLNLGIPLFPTCLMPFVGLKFPILNGFKGMAAGLAVGQVVKRGVVALDKFIKKSKNNDTQKA